MDDNIKRFFPKAMKAADRWLVRHIFAGADSKQPCSPLDECPAGYKPTPGEGPNSWRWRWQQRCNQVTLDKAVEYIKAHPGECDGLSFVVHPGHEVGDIPRIIGIDFDDAFGDDGKPHAWIQAIIDVAESFVEYSRSGKGLHLFVRVKCLPFINLTHHEHADGGAIEVLCNSQLAVTGRPFGSPCEISDVPFSFLESLPFFKNRETVSTASDIDFHQEWWNKDYQGLSEDATSLIPEMRDWEEAIRDPNHPCDSHDVCIRAARYGINRGFVGHELVELLKYCPVDVPWTDKELRHKVESAYARAIADGTFDTVPIPTRDGSEFGVITPVDEIDEIVGDVPEVPQLPRVMTTKFLLSYACQAIYLINGVLAKGQPCIIGGSKKTLKTSLAAAMGVALATGTKFLGYFDVLQPANVLFVSGESGIAALQSICLRILASLGLDDATRMFWSTHLPRIGDKSSMQKLVVDIKSCKAEVLILDPVYLCMTQASADKAGNLFAMGPLLRTLGDTCERLGVTLVLLHHLKKSAGAEFDLNDLSFSGFAEYARQWVMLKRRNIFNAGRSDLRMNIGGSLGHAGDYRTIVEEGVLDAGLGLTRKWDVKVMPIDPEEELRVIDDSEEIMGALEDRPLSMKAIREATGMNRLKVDRLVTSLEAEGVIRRLEAGKYTTFELIKNEDPNHECECEGFGD